MFSSLQLAALFATLAAWRAGQNAWLLTDAIATMVTGTSLLLVPRFLLLYQTTVELDPVSVHLTRVAGLMLLSSSYASHRAFASRDRLDKYVVTLSRAITALLFVTISLYSRIHYPEWSDGFLDTCTGGIFWLLPHVFYAVSALPFGRTDSIQISSFLVMDFFLTIAAGFLWFGFPQGFLRMQTRLKPNSISVTISRFLGAFLIGNAISSILAACLCSLRTRQCFFSVKVVTALGTMILVILGHAWGESYFTNHVLMGTAASVIWGLNSVLGYMMISLNYIGDYKKKRRPLHPLFASHTFSGRDVSNAALSFSKETTRMSRRATYSTTEKESCDSRCQFGRNESLL